jgi:cell division protein FtsB
VSQYGQENGYVDYRTLAKAFDAVLQNDIIEKTNGVIGFWEQISGFVDNSEEIAELENQIDFYNEQIDCLSENASEKVESYLVTELAKIEDKIREIEEEIEDLKDEQYDTKECFQYYIVSENGAGILRECEEIVFYNYDLDMYVWGVTHGGTSWDYVLTNIKIEKD